MPIFNEIQPSTENFTYHEEGGFNLRVQRIIPIKKRMPVFNGLQTYNRKIPLLTKQEVLTPGYKE